MATDARPRPEMSRQTRMVFDRWPVVWIEWHAALDHVQRQLGFSRRSIASRAAWLLRHGFVDRFWAERFRGGERYTLEALITRKRCDGD